MPDLHYLCTQYVDKDNEYEGHFIHEHQASGGANLRFISHILSLLLLSAVLLLATSCEKEITPPVYQSQLQRYHTESLALQQVTADSVHRFQLKVSDFAVAYPEVTSEQLYHQIRQNIYDAYLVIGIEPGAWGEDKEIEFTFGKY